MTFRMCDWMRTHQPRFPYWERSECSQRWQLVEQERTWITCKCASEPRLNYWNVGFTCQQGRDEFGRGDSMMHRYRSGWSAGKRDVLEGLRCVANVPQWAAMPYNRSSDMCNSPAMAARPSSAKHERCKTRQAVAKTCSTQKDGKNDLPRLSSPHLQSCHYLSPPHLRHAPSAQRLLSVYTDLGR